MSTYTDESKLKILTSLAQEEDTSLTPDEILDKIVQRGEYLFILRYQSYEMILNALIRSKFIFMVDKQQQKLQITQEGKEELERLRRLIHA